MKRSTILTGFFVIVVFLLLIVVPVSAQAGGVSVTCNNGTSFSNGVEVKIHQMRTGFNYIATAIGLNGFDPVLAVLNSQTGSGLCTDDDPTAAQYTANLPTTGLVSASSGSSRVTFSNTGSSGFADVSLVVGGYGNSSGRFLLILEGMAVTAADGSGDPFSVEVTPEMIASGVPLTVYMISALNTTLDPLIYLTDASGNSINDSKGNPIGCDDAGDSNTCAGQSSSLANSFVTYTPNGQFQSLPGAASDAMLSLPINVMTPSNDPAQNTLHFLMTSYQRQSTGQYVVVFDIGIGAGASQPQPQATAIPQQPQGNLPSGGASVTCNGGTNITNGVEVKIRQMRTGFNYTATAVGVSGFDPVLAVVNSQSGSGLCTDNDPTAAQYQFNLPSTGAVAAAPGSSQVPFSNTSSNAFEDISLVVGSRNNTPGRFLLVLEGMAVSSADGAGDPFQLTVTPAMVASGVPLSVYMISTTNSLDPLMELVDSSDNLLRDSSGNQIYCDDAGNTGLCWGQSVNLGNSFVTFNNNGTLRRLGGGDLDAMIGITLDNYTLSSNPAENTLTFLMTSSGHNSVGQYVVVFDIGLGSGGGTGGGSGKA